MLTIGNFLKDGRDRFSAPRLLRCLCGLACTIFFAPLLLCAYLLVRADGGPAFVGYERTGQDGTPIKAWRFRTVHWSNGRLGGGRRGRDEESLAEDSNITLLGSFLRKTRIDILPLLYNIVRGELSLGDLLPGPRKV